jgi:DNA-binding XRE family transcriptional regulator
MDQRKSDCRVNTTYNVVFTASLISLQMGILPTMTAKRFASVPTKPAPISIALGGRIKQRRHEVEKSQETLAFEAHVDRTYISAIERGIANPSIETLANICYALNVTLAELFEPLAGVSLAPTGERRANAATPPEIKRSRFR